MEEVQPQTSYRLRVLFGNKTAMDCGVNAQGKRGGGGGAYKVKK